MNDLARLVIASISEGAQGIVVTHGTDTMEETAYALALQVPRSVPVVLTGAMRSSEDVASDGAANLRAALLVAATDAARQLGPVVVMQDEIHLARFVSKAHTSALRALGSHAVGPVGEIVEERVRIFALPAYDDWLGLPARVSARVDIVLMYAGSERTLFDCAVRAADGVVVAGLGGGHLPPLAVSALDSARARGVPVVLCSRGSAGEVLIGTYGGRGSERDAIDRGALPAGSLVPTKARLRLLMALELGIDPPAAFPV